MQNLVAVLLLVTAGSILAESAAPRSAPAGGGGLGAPEGERPKDLDAGSTPEDLREQAGCALALRSGTLLLEPVPAAARQAARLRVSLRSGSNAVSTCARVGGDPSHSCRRRLGLQGLTSEEPVYSGAAPSDSATQQVGFLLPALLHSPCNGHQPLFGPLVCS